jgi:acetyl esterase/lipase
LEVFVRRTMGCLAIVALLVSCANGAGSNSSEAVPSSTTDSSTTSVVAEGTVDPDVVENLVYHEGDQRFLASEGLVDVVVPASGGPWPVVVVLHGDPRFAGKRWSMPMATELAQEGRLVFVPDWGHTSSEWESEATLQQQWDSLVAELRCALLFAEATAVEYGGDPDHVTVMGYSAGGNAALMTATSDMEPLERCAASGPVVDPQAVVSIEGDLLIGAPDWDQEFADNPDTFYSFAPWRNLDEDDRFPIHILAAEDTLGAERSLAGADPYTTFLADRHTDIDLIAELDAMGVLDDDTFSNQEAQHWAYQALLDAGYQATWALLTDSHHASAGSRNWAMSDEAWQLTIDTVVNAEN